MLQTVCSSCGTDAGGTETFWQKNRYFGQARVTFSEPASSSFCRRKVGGFFSCSWARQGKQIHDMKKRDSVLVRIGSRVMFLSTFKGVTRKDWGQRVGSPVELRSQ